MFVLLEFHDNYFFVGIAAGLLLVSSFVFLNALFTEKSKEWSALYEQEENKNGVSGRHEEEFKVKIINGMETMNRNQTQILGELKSQKQMLQEEIKQLKSEISSLSEQQTVQTKTVVKYNKENAKQIALSEKKVLQQAVNDLKEVIVEYSGRMVMAPVTNVMENSNVSFVEEVSKELPNVEEMVIPEMPVELPTCEEIVIPEMPVELPTGEEIVIPETMVELSMDEEIIVPETTVELPMDEEMLIPELPSMEELGLEQEELDLPVLEDIVVPKPEPVDSDPNKMMTPDDIAKLLASMGM